MMKHIKFLLAVWKANLQSAMEYRVSFLSQMIGMMLNDAMYFIIWVLFFNKFQNVRGWGLTDMYITFGITASAFGLVSLLFGNAFSLGDIITKGRLDYYLSLPRPVLLHALASRTVASGMGDLTYGFVSFGLSGAFSWGGLARFVIAIILAACVFMAFIISVQSLAFWIGSSNNLAGTLVNAIMTFAIYPITVFDGTAKLILFSLIPAALMGAVPAAFARAFSWTTLGQMLIGAAIYLFIAIKIFYHGLARYESGSAIQTEL
jgi:ABC-2 type transport system permease protein